VEFRYKWKQIIIFFQISSETTRVVTATVAAFDVPPQGLSLAGSLDLDTEIGCFLFMDPLPVKVAQHHNALQVFVANIT
jgi:hypothetical protein